MKPLAQDKSLKVELHGWRGIGADIEPDLFFWRWRFGVVSISICRVCVLGAYWQMKARVEDLKAEAHNARMEAERLRGTIAKALRKAEEGR